MLDETQEFLVTYGAYFRALFNEYLPEIIGSFAIVLIGWFLAVIIRLIIIRVLHGLDYLAERKNGHHSTSRKRTVSRVAADVVFWFLIIFALILGAQNLGFPLLMQVLQYFPNLILAAIIFFIGYVLANLFRNILRNSLAGIDKKRAYAIAQLAKWLTIVFFAVLAVDQLQINITLLSSFTVIGFSAAVFCLALTFALSFTEILKNVLACQQIQKQLEIGRPITLDGIEGKVVDFTQTHILLETKEGVAHIPAHMFQQKSARFLSAFK